MRISDWSSDVCSSDLEDVPGVVARHSRVHIGIVCPGPGVGRAPLTARPAAMLGRGIVREDALAVADGLADRLFGKVALVPDPAAQPLRHLTAVDRQDVTDLRLLRKLLPYLRALGADRLTGTR